MDIPSIKDFFELKQVQEQTVEVEIVLRFPVIS